jgi:hypothetical protein
VFTRGVNVQYANQEMIVDGSSLVAQRQVDADTYEEIEISGFVHINNIYLGKAVFVTAWDAFNEPDEEGFLLPLNEQMLREMSIPVVTQMSYDCIHMVLNCYKVVKKKWYQQGWFAILLIIIAIIILVVSWGTAAPAAQSLIGMGIAMLGGGMIAMIIMATVTVLAGMMLAKILTPVFTDIFGETWGPIIAAIVSMFAMNYAATGTLLGNMTTMQLDAKTIIQGSMSALNMYGKYMEGKIAGLDVNGQIEALKTEYEARTEEIKKLTKENLGTNTDMIDIQGMIDATSAKFEGPESFFRRTLITGDDVCNITRGLIEDFVEVGLQLPTTP